MPIVNFIEPERVASVQRGDVLFMITDPPGSMTARRMGHAGIAVRNVPAHKRGSRITVVHMATKVVARHIWTGENPIPPKASIGDTIVPGTVDVCGSAHDDWLDVPSRDTIVHVALAFRPVRTLLSKVGDVNCYYQGDPHPDFHPDFPDVVGSYAFSCTTFVAHCYRAAGIDLVKLSDAPDISANERQLLREFNLTTQKKPFKRLTCGHLICALEKTPQVFPFEPRDNDWAACSDSVTFSRLIEQAIKGLQAPVPE